MHNFFIDDSEGDTRIVARTECSLVRGGKLAFPDGHLVQLLEVSGVRLIDLRLLVRLPLIYDLLCGLASAKLWLAIGKGVVGQPASARLRFTYAVFDEKNIGLLAK